MAVILTSLFPKGIPDAIADEMRRIITKRDLFVFIACDFENKFKTKEYLDETLELLSQIGIFFRQEVLIDKEMPAELAQNFIAKADVVWLCGGNTPVQMKWLKKYRLVSILQNHTGVLIGLSAGAINLAETAVCSLTCRHSRQEIYPGLGCVPISPEPHFCANPVSEELLELSKSYPLYGMEDESAVFFSNGKLSFFGNIYKVKNGRAIPVSTVGSPFMEFPQ